MKKKYIFILLLVASCILALFVRFVALPWDKTWIQGASRLAYQDPNIGDLVVLDRSTLDLFLKNLKIDISKQLDHRSGFNHLGEIEIGGNKYKIELRFDKFTGESIIVYKNWRKIEFFCEQHILQLTGART